MKRRIGIAAAAVAAAAAVGSFAVLSTTEGPAPCGQNPTWPTSDPAPWQGSIDASVKAAQPGQRIVVPSGTYGGQTITAAPSGCVLVDATGATFGGFEMDGAQHIAIRGATITGLWNVRLSTVNSNTPTARIPADLVFEQMTAKTFLVRNVDGLTVRDSRIGGWDASITPLGPPKIGAYESQNGAPARLSTNVLIERVLFHDMIRTLAGTAHAECFYFDAGVDGITIKDSTFTNCAVFDIFSNGETAGRPITNVRIESSFLDVSRDGSGGGAGSTVNVKGGASNWTFRGNSILGQGGTLRNDTAGYPGFVFERNAIQNASFGWIGSATWTGNVMSAPAPGQQQAKPVGFVSASIAQCDLSACYRNDLHVIADSPAGRAGAGVPAEQPPPPTTTEPPPTTTTPPEPICPTKPGVDPLPLRLVAQDATTVTYGWDPVAGVDAYFFNSTALGDKWPHTRDVSRTTVRFAKGSRCYRVKADGPIAEGAIGG